MTKLIDILFPKRTPPYWAVALNRKLDIVIGDIVHLKRKQEAMAKTLDEMLTTATSTLAQVQQNETLDQSIFALVAGQAQQLKDLKAQLDAAGTDPTKLAQLGDMLDQLAAKATADGEATAAAIVANTPAADPAPADPVDPATNT